MLALISRDLLDNLTKLAEAKFFIRSQQRSLGIDDPVVTSSQTA